MQGIYLIIIHAPKNDFAAKTHSLPLRVLPLALEGEFLAVAHCKVIIKRLIPTFLHSLLYYHRRLVDVKMRNDVCINNKIKTSF